jgi:hypothetical protein
VSSADRIDTAVSVKDSSVLPVEAEPPTLGALESAVSLTRAIDLRR